MKIAPAKTQRTLLAYFFLAAAIIGAYKIIIEINIVLGWIQYIFSIISPFLIGFMLAYVLNMPASFLNAKFEKSKNKFLSANHKIFSIASVYILLIFIIVFVLRLIVPAISSSIAGFFLNFSDYYANIQDLISYLNTLPIISTELNMNSVFNMLKDYTLENLTNNITTSIDALSGIFSAFFTTFLAFVSSIYILFEKDKFKKFLNRILAAIANKRVYQGIIKYTGDLNRYFKQYIYCQTIDGMILGTLVTLELLFIIRSPYFLLLGIMLGVVNYIPYFGSIFGSLIAVAVVGFTQGLTTAIFAAVVLLATQQLDGNIIQPRLMGSSFALSPLLIIISISFGGAFAGPLGMIAAIPIAAVIKNMIDDFICYLEQRKKEQG